jgi:sortase (surface protein transpeptidase)
VLGNRGPVIWASGAMLAVVLLATAGGSRMSTVGVPDAPTAGPTTAEALTVAEPAHPVLAPPDWVGATPMTASVPARLEIPTIGVDSELMDLGLNDDGTMEVPPGGFPAGWYTGAPTPGELGPAVIAGHVDWTGPGVFHELHLLAVGDEVTITRVDGSTATFGVTRVEQYPKDAFPTAEVYGDIDHAGLRLITCGGVFNRETGSHDDNIVVFAELR